MKFEKGLNTDCNPIDQPESTYRFAKNMLDNNTILAKEAEEGFTLEETLSTFDDGTRIIGVIPVGEAAVLFSTDIDGTGSEIGLWENNTYTTIYNNNDLAFNVDNPIKGEYRINVRGERIVAWVDGLNPDRILNIDDLSLINSINDLSIDQDITNPSLSFTISDTGGSLPVGAYIPMTRYKGLDGSVTPWFIHDWTAYINDDAKSLAFEQDDGAVGGTTSNKAIVLTFSNCDTRFDLMEIGYMSSTENVINFYLVAEKAVAATVNYTITGTETATQLSEAEVLTPPASYRHSKAITQVNGQLIRANLSAEGFPDLQRSALNIVTNYTAEVIDVTTNNGNHKDNLPPGFMPGEVYALYLGVELLQGGWALYHIPGRASSFDDKSDVTQDTISYKKYQLDDTSSQFMATTNMGYWENIGEVYPSTDEFDATSIGGADLRGQPVRHHRFPIPSVLPALFPSETRIGINRLVYLGLTVSNVVIPPAIQSQIKRWKVFFAKKDINNSIVLGADLLQYGANTGVDSAVRWSTGGNWDTNARQAGSGSWVDLFMQKDNIRCHALDYLYEQSNTITPTCAQFYHTLKRKNLNDQWAGFSAPFGGEIVEMGEGRGQSLGLAIDYTSVVSTELVAGVTGFIRQLRNFKFLPNNAVDGKFKTTVTEGTFVADMTDNALGFGNVTASQLRTNSPNWDDDLGNPLAGGDNGREITKYYHLCRLLSSVHVSFYQQEVAPTVGYAAPDVSSLTVKGGDTFCCVMSYLSMAPKHGETEAVGSSEFEGVRVWRAYVGYSKRNWNYRHEDAGDLATKYYAKTNPRTMWNPTANILLQFHTTLISAFVAQNQIRYNTDFNFINTFTPTLMFNPFLQQETEFPTLVIWSNPQGEEAQDVSWRIFPAGNRYSMPRNKGEIINVQGVRNRDILIHHKYSLYKTVTDSSLGQTTGEKVYLQSTGFFDVPPLELISSTDGYGGTQNKFSCILSKVGYFFVDDLQGKVFLYDGEQLDEISSFGLRQFFRDKMGVREDNPFTANGYTAIYDEKYNRFVLTKKGDLSWTVSYSPTKHCWVSYHDYVPDYMFKLVDNTAYAITDSRTIYSMNTGPRGVYFGEEINPWMIDVVFNPEKQRKKLFMGVEWRTESFSTDALQYTDTFDHLTVASNDQCTGRIEITRFTNMDDIYSANLRNLHGTWQFNALRDIVITPGFRGSFDTNYVLDPAKLDSTTESYEQRKLIDNFVICRLEYNNANNNQLLLYEADINYRPHVR